MGIYENLRNKLKSVEPLAHIRGSQKLKRPRALPLPTLPLTLSLPTHQHLLPTLTHYNVLLANPFAANMLPTPPQDRHRARRMFIVFSASTLYDAFVSHSS